MRRPHTEADLVAVGSLSLAWWAAVMVIGPWGELPTNDDWGYAPPVRLLVEQGGLRFTDWQSMPLLSQVLWGALFCLPGGFSYQALRISTITAAWLGVLASYWLMREVRAPARTAALGAAALAINPLWMTLACSFMTDVPFVAALTAASAAWVRGTMRGSASWRALGVVLAIVATLDRQLGIALPLAWILLDGLRLGPGRRWALGSLMPGIAVIASLFVFQFVVQRTVGLPSLYHEKTRELGEAIRDLLRLRGLRYPIERALWSVSYVGLFTLPLLALAGLASKGDGWRARALRALPLAGALFGAGLAVIGRGMPMTGNVWIDLGVGPRTMPGEITGAPGWLWMLISAFAGAGAVMLVAVLVRGARAHGVVQRVGIRELVSRLRGGLEPQGEPSLGWIWALLLLTPLIAYAPTSIAYGFFFDRYLLVMMPFALALVCMAIGEQAPSRLSGALGGLAIMAGALFTVPAVHDYFAWQRARWGALHTLEREGVARADVMGGFEVDNARAAMQALLDAPRRPPSSERASGEPPRALIEHPDAPWAIALSELPGYRVERREPVSAWLPYAVREILVLRRGGS